MAPAAPVAPAGKGPLPFFYLLIRKQPRTPANPADGQNPPLCRCRDPGSNPADPADPADAGWATKARQRRRAIGAELSVDLDWWKATVSLQAPAVAQVPFRRAIGHRRSATIGAVPPGKATHPKADRRISLIRMSRIFVVWKVGWTFINGSIEVAINCAFPDGAPPLVV